MCTKLLNSKLFDISQRLSALLLTRNYAKAVALGKAKGKKLGGAARVTEKIIIPVEKDVNKLLNYVCGSNINVDGEDVKLKPESEYPDWLWDIHVGPPKKLEELDPNTKEYWRRVRSEALNRNNRLRKLRRY